MSDIMPYDNHEFKQKSFWKRPEGVTGLLFLAGAALGVGFLIVKFGAQLALLLQNTLWLALTIMAVGALLYVVLDPKMRNLIWYMYKSAMRWITGVFVNIDPIGVLKSYVEDLSDNLVKMRKQIGILRGQMRKISTLMESNEKEIQENLKLAAAARDKDKDQQFVLSTRKAARLKDSNEKYKVLYQKMEVLYRILNKMHQNSEVLLEDTKDQVSLKEQERKAIRASHSAMTSAMSVISGDPDKRAMFEMAMEAVAEDVANKVGEMERFMEMSSNIMDSVDLQNGVFQEEGLKMLEQWEKDSTLMLLDSGRKSQNEGLDLDSPRVRPEQSTQGKGSNYDKMFD